MDYLHDFGSPTDVSVRSLASRFFFHAQEVPLCSCRAVSSQGQTSSTDAFSPVGLTVVVVHEHAHRPLFIWSTFVDLVYV